MIVDEFACSRIFFLILIDDVNDCVILHASKGVKGLNL